MKINKEACRFICSFAETADLRCTTDIELPPGATSFSYTIRAGKLEKPSIPKDDCTNGQGGGKSGGRGGGRGGGLASVLGQLGKQPKLSVLEKSKLDWNEFKKEEGIVEELQTHNKGKEGYLEKQDFLQRADLRQFEIEKQLRASNKRSLR